MAQAGRQVDAYVFMHLVDPGANIREVLDRFGSMPSVRFAHQFVGSFIGFGAVTVADLAELQDLIAGDFWGAGVRSEWSIVFQESRMLAPHKTSPPHYALVRVKAAPGMTRAVLRALDDVYEQRIRNEPPEFHYAAAIVSGRGFDILVELAADSLQEVQDSILTDLASVDGVVSTDSSFAVVRE